LKDKFPLLPNGLPEFDNASNAAAPLPVVYSPVTSQVPPTDIEPANAEVATNEPANADAPIFVSFFHNNYSLLLIN